MQADATLSFTITLAEDEGPALLRALRNVDSGAKIESEDYEILLKLKKALDCTPYMSM